MVPIGDVGATINPVGWQEVAEAVVNRRVELGMRTRKQLADASGLTVKTLGEVERAERRSYDPATLATIEQALQWPAGRIARLRNEEQNLRVGDAVISRTPDDRVRIDQVADDDSDPLEAKLERLPLLAQGLNPTDRRRLADSVQLLLEWVDARHGVPEMTAEERERLEQFQRTTRALNKATAEHAEQQPVPPMSSRRRSEVRTDG